MKKNGFLTFIFACIPGAGQMYYGYMQRGLDCDDTDTLRNGGHRR